MESNDIIVKNFAEIAVNRPLDRTFHYSVPDCLKDSIAVGKRVWVDFGHKREVGYVVGFASSADVETVKPVESVIDEEPVFSEQMLRVCRWMSGTYMSSLGEAIAATIPGAIKKGNVRVKPRAGTIEENDAPPPSAPHALTKEQSDALSDIADKVESSSYRPFLLHGITASGKTEVYMQAIERVMAKGKTSIVLVPEISLTPQTLERFISRFGDLVAVVHSGLVGSMRYTEWERIRSGRARIVVGARSAIFSPVKNLGLIIVDEEHETSYKQDDVPRYHARDVALMRAELSNCPVIMGTATPSLESFYLAKKGVYELVRLTKRIEDRQLPRVKVVDMRMELETRKKLVMFSRILVNELENTLKNGKQAIIFLNRRGFATYVSCKKCGYVVKCRRCDAIMVQARSRP
ncbi:MAG: primosomal protein N' [Candidatus Omnitrophota bacterium]